MPLAGDLVDSADLLECVVESVIAKHGQERGELLAGEAVLAPDLVLFDDDERAVIGDAETGGGRQFGRRLRHGGDDPAPVLVPHRALEQRLLGAGCQVPTFVLELGDHRVVDAIVDEQVAVG
jgi:hypothetical protein